MRRWCAAQAAAWALCALAATGARAELVTFTFRGAVSDSYGHGPPYGPPLGWVVPVGTPVAGTITYDPATPWTNSADGGREAVPPGSITVTVPGNSIAPAGPLTARLAPPSVGGGLDFKATEFDPGDPASGRVSQSAELWFDLRPGTDLGGGLPNDLARLPARGVSLYVGFWEDGFTARIDDVRLAGTPEPGALALAGAGAILAGLGSMLTRLGPWLGRRASPAATAPGPRGAGRPTAAAPG